MSGSRTYRRLTLLAVIVVLVIAAGALATVVLADSPSASPASGKVIYRVGWTREPDNLNPFIGYAAPAFEIWYLTYDSLIGYDPKTLAPMKG